jgi:hypothetical protein
VDDSKFTYVIIGLIIIFVAAFFVISGCADKRCKNYSYVMSRIPLNKKVATCKYGMTMSIDRSIVHGTTVNCVCKVNW